MTADACFWKPVCAAGCSCGGAGPGREDGEGGDAAGVRGGSPRWEGAREAPVQARAVMRGDGRPHVKMEWLQAAPCLCS